MDILWYVLLIAHLIGLAAIIGPFLDQWRAEAVRITTTMVWGARAQLVTGLALVGVAMAGDGDLDHVKFAVKLVLAVIIAGLAEVGRKRTDGVRPFWLGVGLLTFANLIVAVVWR